MSLNVEPSAPPEAFARALRQLEQVVEAPGRPELVLQPVPAPRRLAPWACAVAGEVWRGDDELASGRLVVLHDPAGQDGWHGDTRVVALVQARVDPEMAADPSLTGAGWSWLLEALDVRAATYTAAGGTVTRTVSQRFGALDDRGPEGTGDVEVRASWTAVGDDDGIDLVAHLRAWCDLLCATAGLPPEGVAALPVRPG